jgi:hypothetical protein
MDSAILAAHGGRNKQARRKEAATKNRFVAY